MSQLTVQEFNSFSQLPELRQDWNRLVEEENYGPSQSFEWLSTLWEVNKPNCHLIVLIIREGKQIAGIAPIVREVQPRKGVRAKLLRMLSDFHSLHGTPLLLRRGTINVIPVLLEYLFQSHGDWTVWFNTYQVGDPQEGVFHSSLRERGHHISTTPGARSPYQSLQETWEEKLKTLQPRFRTALRSREKRLHEKGKVELRFLDSPSEWEHGLSTIREIEEDSWKVATGTAITAQDFQWEFYKRYAPIAAGKKTLRIPILYLNDEPLAYDYALFESGVYYLLKTSYKNKWQESYPGFVLRKLLVEWAYSQRAREIDYLGKDEDWKMKWTNSVREHRECYAFGRTLAARYLHGLHRMRTLLKLNG